MKILTWVFAVLFFSFLAGNIFAQSEENPTLVVSFQKVKLADVGPFNKLVNEKFAPILNGMVDEGLLLGWGIVASPAGDDLKCQAVS